MRRRVVGYFSTTLYHVVALAFSDFVRRGKHMLYTLTAEDFAAMKGGTRGRALGPSSASTLRQQAANGCEHV